MKIITEPIINQAIARGTYCRKEYPELSENRSRPIVDIPDTKKGAPRAVPEKVDYPTVRNSFSGRVGAISNFAIKAGRVHYYGEQLQNYKTEDIPEPPMCTILTGLEIDAAKTGIHPELPSQMNTLARIPDYFLKNNDSVEKIRKIKKQICIHMKLRWTVKTMLIGL